MKSLRGFTLLEMIVSMVIVSILTLGLMNFGILSSELYVESKHRISALEEARFVMARFNRELVNALPYSPRLVGDQQECLEYIPLLAVAEYDPDSFTLGGDSSNLTLLTPLNDEVSFLCSNGLTCRAAIFPSITDDLYGNATDGFQTYQVSLQAGNSNSIVLTNAVNVRPYSVSNRIFLYAPQARQFCINSDQTVLYFPNYAIENAGHGTAVSGAASHVFARGVLEDLSNFNLGVGVSNSNIASLQLFLSINNSTESVEFVQNAQILNSQ